MQSKQADRDEAEYNGVPRTTPTFQATNPANAPRIVKYGVSDHVMLGRSATAAIAKEMADLM